MKKMIVIAFIGVCFLFSCVSNKNETVSRWLTLELLSSDENGYQNTMPVWYYGDKSKCPKKGDMITITADSSYVIFDAYVNFNGSFDDGESYKLSPRKSVMKINNGRIQVKIIGVHTERPGR